MTDSPHQETGKTLFVLRDKREYADWRGYNEASPSEIIEAARGLGVEDWSDFPSDEDVEVATEAIGERLTLAALPGRGVLREAARAALQAVADARRTEEE